jgi:uncharacterized RDD family membrane protein YckC
MLLGTSLLISKIFKFNLAGVNPVIGQLIAFVTLTFPVILYFTLSENGKYGSTIGKRKLRLHIVSKTLTKASFGQLLLRNCIKFFPWELAHFFIFRLFYFTATNKTTPDWVLTGLIASQLLAIIYLLFIIFNKNNRSIYEIFSQTRVVQKIT